MRGRREYNWTSRLDRALTQRIYMMHEHCRECNDHEFRFRVMGATGMPYDVVVDGDGGDVYCSCPDHTTRGNFCKHLIFMFIRVLQFSSDEVYNQYFSHGVYTTTPQTVTACQEFFRRKERAIEMLDPEQEDVGVAQKPIDDEDDCPICYENFSETADETVLWCRAACGKSVHENCFMKWTQARRQDVTCVYCLSIWRWN